MIYKRSYECSFGLHFPQLNFNDLISFALKQILKENVASVFEKTNGGCGGY